MTHISILTPSYDGKVTSEYMQSIIDYLISTNLNISYSLLPNESLVTRARNALFNEYYYDIENKDFSHLLWQDSDIGATGYGLSKLVDYQLDVVGMAVPLKTYPSPFGIECAIAGVTGQVDDFLYTTKYLGSGIMMLSNKVIKDIVSYCEENNLWSWNFPLERKEYDVFRVGVNSKNFYQSEDWYLCEVLANLGYTIYVDSSSTVSHSGYVRKAIQINPDAILLNYNEILPIELRTERWCPSDSSLPSKFFD